MPIPERLRKVRRSIVLPRNAAALRLSRLGLLVAVLAFLVSNMAASGLRLSPYGSNFGCALSRGSPCLHARQGRAPLAFACYCPRPALQKRLHRRRRLP